MTDGEKVAQRYRELGAEEPPRALDEAILAAARREAGAGPASPSLRSSRQRWYAPLATAAVLVLAVAVTLNMQRERPGIDSPAPPPPRADQPAPQQELKLKAEERLAPVAKQPAKEMSPARRKEAGQAAPAAPAAPAVPATRAPQPFAADRAAASAGSAGPASPRSDDSRGVESSVTGSLAREMEERTSRDADAASRAPRMGPFQAQAKRAENTANAEKELERIAQLRVQGRHDEADKALAEFRRRFPDYTISEAMRERVERR
jgi:hypothetical protein